MNFQPMSETEGDSPLGTIATLSQLIANEYELSGFSLTDDDLNTILTVDFALYAGWSTPYSTLNGIGTPLDATQIISFGDWAVLENVVKAHCELVQAQRVEGTGSLGTERFGISVSEATTNYNMAKEAMKKEAFVEPPFSF